MKLSKSVMGLTLTAAVAALVCAVPNVAAAQSPEAQQTLSDEDARTFAPEPGRIVNRALSAINAEQHEAALMDLNAALALSGLSPYERSTILQMIGSAQYEMNNISAALNAFEQSIAAGGLSEDEVYYLRLNTAQLYIVRREFARGAAMLETLDEAGRPLTPAHMRTLWQAWAQAGKFDRALVWGKRWFDAADPKTREHYEYMAYLYDGAGQMDNSNKMQMQADLMQ